MSKIALISSAGISCFLFIFWSRFDSLKNNRRFICKKICDMVVYLNMYIMVVALSVEQASSLNPELFSFYMLSFIAIALFLLFLIFYQLTVFSKNAGVAKKDISFVFIMTSLIFGLICSFSTVYYVLYAINNTWFNIGEITESSRLAFEFVYFTFTMTITYSGSEIVAVGVIPKIVQMLHILIFYLYFADIIINLLKKDTD